MSKKLLKHILPRVRAKRDKTYEIVWVDEFLDKAQTGACNFEKSQLEIKKGQSNTETLKTYIHEIIHFLSNEYDADLTERQTERMELAVYKFLKLNGYI